MRVAMKLGMDGIGMYWCIVEMLYEQGGYISLNGIESIAYELHTECERIKSLLQNFELFKFKDDKFYSESVLMRLKARNEKSRSARESALSRWHSSKSKDANALRTHSEGNAIKESKVKEIKVKEINIEAKIDFEIFWNLYDKKVGAKDNCKKKWDRLTLETQQRILDFLPQYLPTIKDKQFQPYPETWLNQKRWENEIIPEDNRRVIGGYYE
jgi:uncharacterized protein YdaU (DUF1376 family)